MEFRARISTTKTKWTAYTKRCPPPCTTTSERENISQSRNGRILVAQPKKWICFFVVVIALSEQTTGKKSHTITAFIHEMEKSTNGRTLENRQRQIRWWWWWCLMKKWIRVENYVNYLISIWELSERDAQVRCLNWTVAIAQRSYPIWCVCVWLATDSWVTRSFSS